MSRVSVTCPTCHSVGYGTPAALGKKVRCRKCGATFVASHDSVAAPVTAGKSNLDAIELPPTSGVNTVYSTGDDEYRLAADSPPATTSPAPARKLVDELPSDDVVPPPKSASIAWAFTCNVFTFPWTPAAVPQWLVSMFALIIAGELALFTIINLFSGSAAHVVLAGFLTLATFWAISWALVSRRQLFRYHR